MTAPRKTRLFLRRITSVGFVDKGACTDADILLFKRDVVEKVGRKMAGSRLDALRAAVAQLQSLLAEVDDPAEDEEDEMPEDTAKAAVDTSETPAPKPAPAPEPAPVDVAKADLEDIQKRLVDAEKHADRKSVV